MTTISVSSTIGIYLTSSSFTNPVAINPGVTISTGGNALYGFYGVWTIQNSGGIASALGNGVYLGSGGSITNAASAAISGFDGVNIAGGTGTVVNDGSIAGNTTSSIGVLLAAGGSVANQSGATISGYTAVDLTTGGMVTNAASASINGVYDGVAISGGAGTVVNHGNVAGTGNGGIGVLLGSGGAITNAADGSIAGQAFGVDLSAGGTLTNAGTVIGNAGTAVYFGGTNSNLLVLVPGYGLSGLAGGATSASNTLELASAASAGTLSGLGTEFVDFGQVTIDAAAQWQMTGINTVAAGGTLSNSGTLVLSGATFADAGALRNDGAIQLDPSTLTVASLTGTGGVTIGSSATLAATGSVASGESIVFGGTNGLLQVGNPTNFAGTIAGFGSYGTIDLTSLQFVKGSTTATVNSDGTLIATNGTATDHLMLSSPLAVILTVTADAVGGTDIFVSGTPAKLASAQLVEPITIANEHVGDALTQAVTITNTAPAGSGFENLDATIGGATAGISATGTVTGLAPQVTDSTHLLAGLDTSTSGSKSGTATVGLTSDGTGVDGNGLTSLPSQTIDVSGSVFAFASPALSTSTFNFGALRVGDTAATQSIDISNGTTANSFQEALTYSLGTLPAGFGIVSGGAGTIASGSTSTVTFSLAAGTAGDFSGETASLGLTSTGAGTSLLPDTAEAAQSITLNGKVYAAAIATLGTTSLNFGIVHVGDSISQALTIGNAATGALIDSVIGGFGAITGAFSGSGTLTTGITAGATGTLSVALSTTTSGVETGSAALALASHDPDQSDLALSAGPIGLTGTVDNFATAALAELSGGGSFSQIGNSYTLDLGVIPLDGTAAPINLSALNDATGLADLLSGTFAIAGNAAFTNAGFDPFAGLGAGGADVVPTVTLSTANAGSFSEVITLHSSGSNSSGYSAALPDQVLTIEGSVGTAPRTLVWTGAAGTNFASAGNWNDTTNGINPASSPPGAADTAEFGAGAGEITGSGTAATLLFNNDGDWQLTSTATVTGLTQLSIGSGSASSVSVTNGADLATNGTLSLGSGGAGNLSVTLGGTVAAGAMDVAALAGGSGIVSAIGAGSSISVTGQLTVGDSASAELSILGGAQVSAANVDIGLNATGTGNVDIEGSGLELNVSGVVNVGDAGIGVLTLGNNTTLHAGGALNIGANGVLNQFGGTVDPSMVNNTGRAGGKGSISASVSIANSGTLFAASGTETLSAPIITGTGVLEIDSKGDLAVNVGSVVATQTVSFTDGTGVLTIGTLGGFAATIGSFISGDSIVVQGTSIASTTFDATKHVLTLFDPSSAEAGVLQFGTSVTDGSIISVNGVTPCFVAGTRIGTERGEVCVEELRVGDLVPVVGAAPSRRPIIWLGHRTVDCTRHPEPRKVWPVRVRAHAFGPGRPARDLWLSPDHAVFVGDVLIPVKYLINGVTIAQVPVQEVTYYHVELTHHAVLLAEGLPAESYLDTGDRTNFANGGGPITLYPDFSSRVRDAEGCAPLVVTGRELDSARHWVSALAHDLHGRNGPARYRAAR